MKTRKIVLGKVTRPLFYIWILSLFITLLSLAVQNYFDFLIFSRILRTSFYIFFIVVITPLFDLSIILKWYKFILIAAITYLFLQYIIYYFFNIYLPFNILPFNIYSGDELGIITNYEVQVFRPSSFFKEPGYFSLFMIPALIMSSFNWKNENRTDFTYYFLIQFAILLSGSTQGIIVSLFITSIIFVNRYRKHIFKLFILFILTGLFLVTVLYIFDFEIVDYTLNKIVFSNIRPGSSTAMRIYRGWAVLSELPPLYKVIGVGHGNIGNFILTNNIFTIYDPPYISISAAEYVNGVTSVLIYYGVFIGSLYIIFLLSIFRKSPLMSKYIVLFILISIFVGGSVLNLSFVYYIAFIVAGYNYQNNHIKHFSFDNKIG
jgi:hypothetical protein